MKKRGFLLFLSIVMLIFNDSIAMDRLDNRSTGSLHSSTGGHRRTLQASGYSGSNIAALSSAQSFMHAQEVPVNLSPSVEHFMQFHRKGTQTYMEAFEEYRANIKLNETAYKAVLPKFYTACNYYLDAWQHGDPTAEAGYIRSFQYAEIIIKLLLEKNKNVGASVYPEEHSQIFQRAQQLREQDVRRFATENSDDTTSVKELYSRGFGWFLQSQTSYTSFILHRDALYVNCVQQTYWAGVLLLQSLQQKQTVGVLKRLIEVLDSVQPTKWGYADWPNVPGLQELLQTIKDVNMFYKIDSNSIEISKLQEALQGLQSISPTSSTSRPSLQKSFSDSEGDEVAHTVADAARAAILGKSGETSSSDDSHEVAQSPAAAEAQAVPPLEFHPSGGGHATVVPPDKPTGSSRQSRKFTPRAWIASKVSKKKD